MGPNLICGPWSHHQLTFRVPVTISRLLTFKLFDCVWFSPDGHESQVLNLRKFPGLVGVGAHVLIHIDLIIFLGNKSKLEEKAMVLGKHFKSFGFGGVHNNIS